MHIDHISKRGEEREFSAVGGGGGNLIGFGEDGGGRCRFGGGGLGQ